VIGAQAEDEASARRHLVQYLANTVQWHVWLQRLNREPVGTHCP
jgi:hypothetical protein